MVCSSCGAENRAGARFCSECGTPLALTCPSCGAAATAGDKFCSECGHALRSTSLVTPPAAQPDQERRFVSVLFIDLVGFTPLTEARDSEEVRSMLTRYFDLAREIVRRFGGVIDKFIGDAVMAVWGADVAHEDDAERAVRAALELVDAIAALGSEVGVPGLTARAGVLSGEAAVGGDGNEGTGLIVGDVVNTASRLQDAAEPGTVLAGESTMRLADKAVEFVSAGSKELRGKAEPVQVWRAVRVVAGRLGDRRSDQISPPFVGRVGEFRLLKDQLHTTGVEGRSRLVSIIGQSGIGKTRLVEELRNYIGGITEPIYWHQGRSPAYGDGLTFWSLGEMVRSRCGIADGDDAHKARMKLRTALAEYVENGDDREWMEPRLAGLLGLGDVPSGDRSELYAAWRTFFQRIAGRGTTVMVFEDLHWADDGVLDFIEELVSIAANQPILVVTLARPRLLERRPGWGSGRGNSLAMHLSPLSNSAMQDLVHGVVPDAPASLVARLMDKAGGVPLYAVELLRMLANRGLMAPDGNGRFAIAADIADLDVPDSLSGLVGARLDQLDPEYRELLQDAAVLGQSFTLEGLAALRSEAPDALTDLLEPLVREEILQVNRDPRSPERGQYHFVQSIIREVAHQRISKVARRDRHLRVAEYLGRLDDPELAAAIASHLLEALEVSSPGADTDALRDRALEALLIAADRAAALQSHAQVVSLCTRGIQVAGDGQAAAELWLRAAESAHAGLDEKAEEYAERAIAAFDAAGNDVGRIRATTVLARNYSDTGRAQLGRRRLRDAIDASPGSTRSHADAMAELARGLMLDQRTDEALEWCDRALTIAEELDDLPVLTQALTTKGTALGGRAFRRPREGVALLEAALGLAREYGLTHARRRALTNLAYLTGGDMPFNRRYELEQLEDARRIGEPRYLTSMTITFANNHLWDFEWAQLDALLADIDLEDLPSDTRDDYQDLVLHRRLITGEPAAAEVELEQIHERRTATGDAQVEFGVELDRACVAFMNGRFEEAFDRAIRADDPVPASPSVAWALVAALQLRDRAGLQRVLELIEARPFRGRAIDMLRDAATAGVAALEGRDGEAERLFEVACAAAVEVFPKTFAYVVVAGAAGLLGLDHPLGRQLGRDAYDAYAAGGATTLLEVLSDCLLPPESGERASTA